MRGRRRALRLSRTGWGTAWWFLTSRAAITAAVVAVLVMLAAVLAWTKPWQALTEERVVYVPVPVVVTVDPGSDSPAPDRAPEQS
ncbi:MAG TPA: hypothetical protein VK053_15030 [Jiangellaceae bacterium]|nr:hypothetical protein [Jiangellaceae bacterium]